MLAWELTKSTLITKGRTRGEKILYLEQLLAFIIIQQLGSMIHRLTTWQNSQSTHAAPKELSGQISRPKEKRAQAGR